MYKYEHGGNANFEKECNYIDLSANINPLGLPNGVDKAIINSIKYINQYPDNFNRKLIESIAQFEDVDKNFIFASNGASDIIFRLPRVFNCKKALVLAPTFSDYERAVKVNGGEIVYHYLKADDDFKLDNSIIETIEFSSPDMIFLCNPNNPTGDLIEFDLMVEIIKYCSNKNTFVVVDECFMDFYNQKGLYSVKKIIRDYKNLVILKAFTKIFALAGIRLGYLITSNLDIIESLYNFGGDWSVSNVAQEAGIAAINNSKNYLIETIKYVDEQREYLEKNLIDMGFKVYKGYANYIFFYGDKSFCIKKELDKKGIRIRHCNNYVGLDNKYYRVAISKLDNNKIFIEKVKEVVYG